MADAQIVAGGVSPAPLVYTVPGAQEIILKSLFATFDGTLAAGAFLPCIRILAPGGKVVGEYITDESVAAGSSAEVSFAPFLRGASAGSATVATANYVSAPRSGYTQFDDVVNFSYPADYLSIGNSSMYDDDGSGRPRILSSGLYEVTMAWQGFDGVIPAATQVEIIAHYSNAGFPNSATNIDPGNMFFSPGTAQGGGQNAWIIWQIAWLDIVTAPCTVWFTIQTTGVAHTAFSSASAAVRIVKLTEASSQGL